MAERPSILLFHGFTGTPWELDPLRRALSSHGYRVQTPLLAGHGESLDALARSTWSDWLASARSALDEELSRGRTIVLGGLSMGGLLATVLSAEVPPTALRGLVLMATALRLQPQAQRALAIFRALGRWMPDVRLPKAGGGSDLRSEQMRKANPGHRVNPLRAARSLLDGQDAARGAMATISSPMLILHGAMDRTCRVEGSWEMVTRTRSTDVEMQVFPASGHVLPVDLEADAVSARVVAFVDRVHTSASHHDAMRARSTR